MTIDELYEEFEDALRRYAMSLTRDSDRADDLVQETFIRAMTNLGLLEQLNGHQRRTWMRRTLKNLFIDEHRARQRQDALVVQLGRETEFSASFAPDLMASDVLEYVPHQDRELLHQRYVLGMTSREIACQLGIPAATVRSRLHLAIKRLRTNIGAL
jgi:RNA polymerase sigma-70 factor (ECF subfamily)